MEKRIFRNTAIVTLSAFTSRIRFTNRNRHTGSIRHTTKLWFVVLLACTIVACSNSSVIISPLYNRLDDQMRKGFENLGEFTQPQENEVNRLLTNFHYWHRHTELPRYATLLSTLQASVSTPGATTEADVTQWLQQSESFTRAFRECHPVNYANGVIRTLTDDQLISIHQSLIKRRAAFRLKYENETKDERVERRSANIIKWASRVGFDFTEEQTNLLNTTFQRQVSLRQQYFALSDAWRDDLFLLLEERDSTGFDQNMATHLDALWHLLERAHPEQWQANRDIWGEFALDFINSLTDAQRRYASGWIGKMGQTLIKVSEADAQKPFFGPLYGCAERKT